MLPILAKLGIPDFHLLVKEGGVLPLDNPEESAVDAYGQFFILEKDVSPKGFPPPKRLGFFYKQSCKTSAQLTATIEGTGRPNESPLNNQVLICPGTPVELFWEYSEDVTHAEITPEIGTLSSNSGSRTVTPTATTTYKLTVTGSCTRTYTIQVVVLTSDSTWDLTISYNPYEKCFYHDLKPGFVDNSLKIISLRPACILNCFIHRPDPIDYYMYLECPGGTLCNGAWDLIKTNPDGSSDSCSIFNNEVPFNQPLAGVYRLLPESIIGEMFGYALLIAKLTCS